MRSKLLGVNIDHVATLRQARGTRYPDPIHAAMVVEAAGADSITLHLREDRRHIQERDLSILKDTVQTRINLEMAVTEEMLSIAASVRPSDCCLVPERREELTTEGGLDVTGNYDRIATACERLQGSDIKCSLFVDPDIKQIEASARSGAHAVEIHTGHFADAVDEKQKLIELDKIKRAVECGVNHALQVNAGHGLNYHNIGDIAAIEDIAELNIGHAIISRALFSGLHEAVVVMKGMVGKRRL